MRISRGRYRTGRCYLAAPTQVGAIGSSATLPLFLHRPSPSFPVLPVFPSRLSHHQSLDSVRLNDRFQLVHHSARQVPVDVLR
jgi:hypothetical protein